LKAKDISTLVFFCAKNTIYGYNMPMKVTDFYHHILDEANQFMMRRYSI